MPDTGAPHFIPFLDGTELVRAYPDFSEDLADAVADGLSAAGNAGIGSNVVQAVKTDTFAAGGGTFQTVTGLSVSITPTSATSKLLVIADVKFSNTAARGVHMRLVRNGSPIYVGDASGSRIRASAESHGGDKEFSSDSTVSVFLDLPNTTSSVTYAVQTRTPAGDAVVNRSRNDGNLGDRGRTASSITVIEVSA